MASYSSLFALVPAEIVVYAAVAHAQSPASRLPTTGAGAPTAFVDVAVVPMDRERVLQSQTVVVRDGQIVALGPANKVPVPAGTIRIDGRGKVLMPGLGDMHFHAASPHQIPVKGVPTVRGVFDGEGLRAQYLPQAERALFLALVNGVTTVRFMGYDPENSALSLKQRAANGQLLSPRIYAAAGPLYPSPSTSPASAANFVREAKAAGYDLVKLYGVSGEVLDSAAVLARQMGIRIAGHMPGGATGIEEAVRAGYGSIEHLLGFDGYVTRNSLLKVPRVNFWPTALVIDEEKLRVLATTLERAGVWSCPTQVLFEMFGWDTDTIARWPGIRYMQDSIVRHTWESHQGSSTAKRAATHADAELVNASRRRIVKALYEAGAGLLLGTDVGGGPIPGFAVHDELQAFVRAGLTPYEALLTGTRHVATYFGTLDSVGTVAVGKRADLVLLSGNPLQDIRHTAHPAGVMIGGRWLARAELDQRLAALEQGILLPP